MYRFQNEKSSHTIFRSLQGGSRYTITNGGIAVRAGRGRFMNQVVPHTRSGSKLLQRRHGNLGVFTKPFNRLIWCSGRVRHGHYEVSPQYSGQRLRKILVEETRDRETEGPDKWGTQRLSGNELELNATRKCAWLGLRSGRGFLLPIYGWEEWKDEDKGMKDGGELMAFIFLLIAK